MRSARSTGRTFLPVAALIAAACGLLAGCGTGGADADVATAGTDKPTTVRLGFTDERPYGYLDENGDPAGQAPTVAMEVFKRMGIKIESSTVVDFNALINGLNARRYDVIAAGMYITEERAGQALFSDPDYCVPDAFGVVEGNPLGLDDYQSITESEAQLGVLSGSVMDGRATDAGVPEDQISRFNNLPDLVDGLTLNKSIDAFAVASLTVREQLENIDGFEPTEGFYPVIDGEEILGCGGYLFRFEDKALRDEFNKVLTEMKQADEILPMVEELGFSTEEIGKAKDLTVEDVIGTPYDAHMP